MGLVVLKLVLIPCIASIKCKKWRSKLIMNCLILTMEIDLQMISSGVCIRYDIFKTMV